MKRSSGWPAGCLGALVIHELQVAKQQGRVGELSFTDNAYEGASFEGGYKVVIKRRAHGKTGGVIDGFVVLSGEAKQCGGGKARGGGKGVSTLQGTRPRTSRREIGNSIRQGDSGHRHPSP